MESRDPTHSTIAVNQAFAMNLDAARITAERISVPVLQDQVEGVLSDIAEILATSGLTDPTYSTQGREQPSDILELSAR